MHRFHDVRPHPPVERQELTCGSRIAVDGLPQGRAYRFECLVVDTVTQTHSEVEIGEAERNLVSDDRVIQALPEVDLRPVDRSLNAVAGANIDPSARLSLVELRA